MNNTITTISILVAILLVVGAIIVAKPGENNSQNTNKETPPPSSNGKLEAEEMNFDFGEISMAKGNVSHMFKIKNNGSEAVTIEKMYTSCMCTTANLMIGDKKFGPYGMPGHGAIPKINQNVNPGEEISVEVIFDPAAHGPSGIGTIQRVVTIENNAGELLNLEFSANVTP